MSKMFVITARDVDQAVILRRGPSQWYHIISWDTHRDQFTHGAWIKGRIYEQNCDLSPNGQLFVYFVMQGSRSSTEFTHAWTAVSRPPWLHALAVWPQGMTWGGGGRFVDDAHITLRTNWPDPFRPLGFTHRLQSLKIVDSEAPYHPLKGDVSDADWSGRDRKGRLIYTLGSKLLRRQKGSDEVLADFADLEPDPQPAPDWARIPLR